MGEVIHSLKLRQSIERKDCTCVNQSIKMALQFLSINNLEFFQVRYQNKGGKPQC
jgi:hypothetical protein